MLLIIPPPLPKPRTSHPHLTQSLTADSRRLETPHLQEEVAHLLPVGVCRLLSPREVGCWGGEVQRRPGLDGKNPRRILLVYKTMCLPAKSLSPRSLKTEKILSGKLPSPGKLHAFREKNISLWSILWTLNGTL